jgi:hypothetical protein
VSVRIENDVEYRAAIEAIRLADAPARARAAEHL